MIGDRAVDGLGSGLVGEGRIQLPDELPFTSLNRLRIPRCGVGDGLTAWTQDGPLMTRRQESGGKAVQPARRHEPAFHHNKARQVVVLAAQAIRHPSPHGWPTGNPGPRVQEVIGIGVLAELTRHRADHAQLIGHPPEVRKELRNGNARLPVLAELPRRSQRVAVVVELRGCHRHRKRLAVVIGQTRLRIEGVHLRRPSVLIKEDHAARPRPGMG